MSLLNSNLIRDNKNILNLLTRRAYPFKDEVTTKMHILYRFTSGAIFRYHFLVSLKTNSSMYSWEEVKHNLYYCLDVHKALKYSNVSQVGVYNTSAYDSISFNSGKLSYDIAVDILKDLSHEIKNLKLINLMLHTYNITNTDYQTLMAFVSDTDVYNILLSKLADDIAIKSDNCLQEFFTKLSLSNDIESKLIKGTNLPLLQYDTKSGNVYIPSFGNISFVDFNSRRVSGGGGREIVPISAFLGGHRSRNDTVLHISSSVSYEVVLG